MNLINKANTHDATDDFILLLSKFTVSAVMLLEWIGYLIDFIASNGNLVTKALYEESQWENTEYIKPVLYQTLQASLKE